MEIKDHLVFLGLSKSHWLRSYSETSDEAKLMRLMAGFNALVRDSNKKNIEFREVVERVTDIINKNNQTLSVQTNSILWQSYYQRCNFIHGRFYDNERIQKLIPKLQRILKESFELISLNLDEQLKCNFVNNVHTGVISDG